MKNELLIVDGITTRHKETEVLSGLFLEVFLGEIQYVEFCSALERDSLFDIFSGRSLPESGRIALYGHVWPATQPIDAPTTGIYCTHAEHALVPSYTVAENMFLANPRCYRHGFRLRHRQNQMAQEYFHALRVDHIDVQSKVRELNLLDCYIVEIAMAIQHGMKLIVLSDLLEKLSHDDMEWLGKMLLELKLHGIGFLCLSNMSGKSKSLLAVADRLTIVKNGQTTAIMDADDIRNRTLPTVVAVASDLTPGLLRGESAVFAGSDLQVCGAARPFSFSLHPGEVLGVDCVSYNASLALSDLLTGGAAKAPLLYLNGRPCYFRKRSVAAAHGVALVHASYGSAVFSNMDLTQNISIMVNKRMLYPYIFRKRRFENYIVRDTLSLLGEEALLHTLDARQANNFSAYHQFILSLSRCIAAKMSVIVLVNPQMSFGSQDIPKLFDCIASLRGHGISTIILSVNLNLLASACDSTLRLE